MIHYVYKITNLINENFYIGSRSHPTPTKDVYMSSSKVMKNLYKLDGVDNFKKEILKTFNTRNEANKYEHELIKELLQTDKTKIYNLRTSGYKNNNDDIFNKRNDVWGDYFVDIRNKYKTGIKPNELARLYGCDRGTIDIIIEDLKTTNKWSKAWNFEKEICYDYQNGISRKSLSIKYSCDIKTIKTILQINQIKLRTIKEQLQINQQHNIIPDRKKHIDLEEFKNLYLFKNLTLRETSKIMGIYEGTLKKFAIKQNIPIKTREYYCKNRNQRHPAWDQKHLIEEDYKYMKKKEILSKYGIKDYATLNKILNHD